MFTDELFSIREYAAVKLCRCGEWSRMRTDFSALARPFCASFAVCVSHMLRHACGFALANAGHDTRGLQAWLGGHNIQYTVH